MSKLRLTLKLKLEAKAKTTHKTKVKAGNQATFKATIKVKAKTQAKANTNVKAKTKATYKVKVKTESNTQKGSNRHLTNPHCVLQAAWRKTNYIATEITEHPKTEQTPLAESPLRVASSVCVSLNYVYPFQVPNSAGVENSRVPTAAGCHGSAGQSIVTVRRIIWYGRS
jgi:hypothetical protein